MKPSADPLVMLRRPFVGDLHPKSPHWRAIGVRQLENADIEGEITYANPQHGQMMESFVLRPS